MLLTLILTLTLSHFLTVSLFLTLTLNLSLNHSWHAEQLLFSSLCSKVTLTLSRSHSLTLSHSHTFTLFQCLIQSLLTCWTSFVFMSMLISRCLLPKIAMLFFDIISSSIITLSGHSHQNWTVKRWQSIFLTKFLYASQYPRTLLVVYVDPGHVVFNIGHAPRSFFTYILDFSLYGTMSHTN